MKPKILLISGSIHYKGNSYLALLESEKGSKSKGAKTDWIHLNEYYSVEGQKKSVASLIEKIKKSDGIIWGTPVYFGEWSSLCQDFYLELVKKKISLFKKVIGFVVVGAKRNGGQETTITFSAWDLMGLGACVVNDGYPVSQFGGTCVGGLIGGVLKDKEGLEMSYNTGKRVAETALILKSGNLKEKINKIDWPLKGKIKRCRSCADCPDANKLNQDYKCKYDDCDMVKIHSKTVNANLINPLSKQNYCLNERTRYLRRDNYRLTYHIVCINEQRQIPFFIKQNCILARRNCDKYASLISSGRKKIKTEVQIYEPIGHENVYLSKKDTSNFSPSR